MFLVAPTGNGQALRVVPCATLLLVLLEIGMAIWILPSAGRLRRERTLVARELALERTESASHPTHLEALRREVWRVRLAGIEARDPFENWGDRAGAPMRRALLALFVHADTLHLLVNVLLLALLGAQLEQVFGPAAVLALFVGGGATALHLDALTGPPTVVVGASAGVAVLLGAYCVRFHRQPLRCGYVHLVYLRPHFGSFQVPCALVGVLWVSQQIVGSWLAWRDGDSSIAFVSHLAGFGIGALAALVALRLRRARLAPPARVAASHS